MLLTEAHIDTVVSALEAGGIRDEKLQADLLDHLCCYLEEQDAGDFEAALREGLRLLAPQGLHEIEEERFFLFHFHKQLTMKRILFFSGFSATFFLATGFTFKLMNWPGANILLVTGNLSLILTILMIAINAFRRIGEVPVSANIRVFTGIVAALLIAMGGIFKTFHFPTSNMQFILGMLLLNFIFLPLFFLQLYRQSVAKPQPR